MADKHFNVKCPICDKRFYLKPSRIKKGKTHCCSNKCSGKYKQQFYRGNNNPNRQYFYDENFLNIIDSDKKAWLLGWFASDGSVAKDDCACISIHKKDVDVLWTIQELLKTNIPINYLKNKSLVSISINSKQIVEDIRKHLNIQGGSKPEQLGKLNIKTELLPHFVRGVFEGDGCIMFKDGPICTISSKSKEFLQYIGENMEIPFNIYTNKQGQSELYYRGNNCLDFLGKLYPDYYNGPRMCRKHDKYLDVCFWKPCKGGTNCSKKYGTLKFMKTEPNAVLPSKAHASDTGYDLTIIKKVKNLTDNVILYDTGIRAECPSGIYLEAVGRSSISKTGYMLANNLGIIDSSYKGNIYVALLKVNPNVEELPLPFKIAQLIPKKILPCELIEVDEFEEHTKREKGGFGSTGK